jgi:PST family polysaccharide transporter
MVVALLCSGSVILGAFDVADCWLQARHKAKVTSSIRLIGFLIGSLVRCLLVIGEASIVWFAVAVIVEASVMATLYFGLLWRHDLTPSFSHWDFVEFKKILVDGKMISLSSFTVAIYSKIDILVIGALFSKEILAPYAIAASMCAAWSMVGVSLVQAWAPQVSLAMATSQEYYIHVLRKMLLVMLGLSVIGSVFLSLFAKFFFHSLYNN